MLHAEVYSLHCHVVMVGCLISPGSMQPHPASKTKLNITKQVRKATNPIILKCTTQFFSKVQTWQNYVGI
jgi:hypothetical protein